MISYEIHMRDTDGDWVKIPDGLTHRKLAKAKEELQDKKWHTAPSDRVARNAPPPSDRSGCH